MHGVPAQPAGTLAHWCAQGNATEWDGGAIATFNFTAKTQTPPPPNGPWTALFDVRMRRPTRVGGCGRREGVGEQRRIRRSEHDGSQHHGTLMTARSSSTAWPTTRALWTSGPRQRLRAPSSRCTTRLRRPGDSCTPTDDGLQRQVHDRLRRHVAVGDRADLLAPGGPGAVPAHDPMASYAGSPIPTSWQHSKVLATPPLQGVTTVVLLGGDATNDDVIEILDAGCIGARYGSAPQACGTGGTSDVNEDGKMDILDLTLMGGNYGKTASPAPAIWAP